MVAEGADIIDVGGESTRPGSDAVSVEEELRRVVPVVEELVSSGIKVSIDTMKWRVAEECVKKGAMLINDVSGLRDAKMVEVAARYKVPAVIMHMLGMPKTMQEEVSYGDVVEEICDYLKKQAAMALAAGVPHVVVDPGIGFGKTVEHNLEILNSLEKFVKLGYPVLIGVSRKSFIGGDVTERLEGTIAANVVAAM